MVAQSPEWAPELDTQAFVRAGSWMVVLHHQAQKAQRGKRTGVEVFPLEDLYVARSESALLGRRQPLPEEAGLAFPSSLAYDERADLLAVGINGCEFRGAVYLYHGVAAGQPRLVNRIDLEVQKHSRPSAMAIVNGRLWIASYSGGFVSVVDRPLNSGVASRRVVGLAAPIGLVGLAGRMYVTTHLDHALKVIPSNRELNDAQLTLNHPWGLDGRETDEGGVELLLANLNLDDAARSWIAVCEVPPSGTAVWRRLTLGGGSNLSGFSTIRFD